jgi:hypothetical protein|tara:strand:+ start:749 stop:1315 length:567 start_codon:yes stop_codon:yes gene_type:complete
MNESDASRIVRAKKRAQKNYELLKSHTDYDRHVATYDLTGICYNEGNVLSIENLISKIARRLELADACSYDPKVSLKIPDTYEKWAGNMNGLDRTKQFFLMEHKDWKRQRHAANLIMDLRADINPMPSIDSYISNVARFIASKRQTDGSEEKLRDTVIARAILIRSTDPLWDRTYKGSLRPLSAAPYK